jgi:ABC-type polysaccharide/polyol phosphate transport system ATPase subunit
MSESAIVLENVSLTFPRRKSLVKLVLGFFKKQESEFTALDKINLVIKQGEIIGVIGTNGCGKSTLLRIISGIYPPNQGNVK